MNGEWAFLVRNKWTSLAVDVSQILDILKWENILSKSIKCIFIVYINVISKLNGVADIIFHKKIDV